MKSKNLRQANILVLGSSGFLGSNLRMHFSDSDNFFFAHSSHPLYPNRRDLVVGEYSRTSLAPLLEQFKIGVIVNCAGFTDVDACESKHPLNIKMNFELPLLLDDLSRLLDVKIVQISTDHFYSEHQSPRVENERMLAINEYGRLKLEAEKVLSLNQFSLIVRTNFFGFNPSQRVKLFDWAKNSLERGVQIAGFEDVFFTPISVSILARTLNFLIEQDVSGLLHVVGSESISKYEFLKMIAGALGCNEELVVRDSIKNLPYLVKRPNYLSLSNLKLRENFPNFKNLSISEMISLEIERCS